MGVNRRRRPPACPATVINLLLDGFHDNGPSGKYSERIHRFYGRQIFVKGIVTLFLFTATPQMCRERPLHGVNKGGDQQRGPLNLIDMEPAFAETRPHREIVDIVERDRCDVPGNVDHVVRFYRQHIE